MNQRFGDYVKALPVIVTLDNCEESSALHIINTIDIAWSGITSVVVFGILYFRVVHRNQQIFDFSGRFPRPKPIESMSVFCMLFNLFRMIHAIVLVTDVAKSAIFRSFLFEFPWSFGITALACYLFGVVHTLSSSSSTIYKSWVKSQLIVDLFCTAMVVLPFITINPLAIVAGYYAEKGDVNKAWIWTETIYYLWLFYTFTLGSMVLFAGLRLVNLLKKHLAMQLASGKDNVAKIQLGTTKVKIIIGIACFCLWAFSLMIAIYISSRYYVMINPIFTVILAALAIFNGPLASSIIEFALLINLNTMNGLSNISFGPSSEPHFAIDHSATSNSNDISTAIESQALTSGSTSIKMDLWNRYTTPKEEVTIQEIEHPNPFLVENNSLENINNNNNNTSNDTSFHNQFGYSLSAFNIQKDILPYSTAQKDNQHQSMSS
ncbi:hypothetical protein BJ944DRAFT_235300 [Cunninghamella echinulata]|nr:hypothetical protein BJ944DRAFT_235300 [Cunninghamella echinulata]